jgi:hypothetical protein
MRLAAIASALAIALCVAVFGAILLQKASLSVPAPPATPGNTHRGPVSGLRCDGCGECGQDCGGCAGCRRSGVSGARRSAGAVALRHADLVQQSQCNRCRAGG